MPYRTAGGAIDAPVSILLVTSRETKRWVIPKGNLVAGADPHTAAALEAEQEAGVIGAGVARRASAVRWGVAQNVVMAWLITIPCSALVAAFFYWLISLFA